MLNPFSWPGKILALVGFVVVAVVAVIVVYFVFIRDDAPPPVSLQSAVQSVASDQEQQSQSASSSETADASASTQSSEEEGSQEEAQSEAAGDYDYGDGDSDDEQTVSVSREELEEEEQEGQADPPADEPEDEPATADLTGTWVLAGTGESFVGYRIGETFADIGTATAVGRTSDIVAELDFDGSAITRVEITADLRNLRSDQSRRDQALRTRGLETDRYPSATFRLAEPIAIPALPAEGETISATVSGTLELHGVTNQISVALEGQIVQGLVVVIGSTDIALADYEIDPPTNFRVLSIEDTGVMEFQIVFQRGS